jgi:potassium efflux system protein
MEVLKAIFEGLHFFLHIHIIELDGGVLTVGGLMAALFILLFGLRFARRISRALVARVTKFSPLNPNGKAILETISFYCLIFIFSIVALDMAQVPVGTFAFLGGAFAIGLGFGSQNIIKNFISGLILMVEQPVRVGNIIKAEGNEGRVVRIGARSTHICTFDNIDIMIPNSTLLENNVVNWTLSDDEVRTRVKVGVAYGSDTLKVEKLLRRSVEHVEDVLRSHPVDVFFGDFGDSSLNFEVQFWCSMRRPSDRRYLESKIRHQIAQIFHEEGIIIAFPQQDVHMDITSPVTVNLQSSKS